MSSKEKVSEETEGASVALAEPTSIDFKQLMSRGRKRATLVMLGPAFVASVAYIDPGNFATNFFGGAKYGYLLLWVVLAANLMAMFVQYLSAKIGIVTGQNLPEVFRDHLPRASWVMWVQAELICMATDIAEILGGVIGLNLLFGVPLTWAGVITGAVAFLVLELQTRGFRRFELAITALIALVVAGFLYETLKIGPSASSSLSGLVPHLKGKESIYLAVGIMGATIMPHVIWLHSNLTKQRVAYQGEKEKKLVLRFERIDTVIAMSLAGLVNLAMLAVAAKLFYHPGPELKSLQQAYHGIAREASGFAATAFAVALLASGIAASSVGTYAGQVVMRGFTSLRISLFLRRGITLAPALILLFLGVNPTSALILSQVVLSFGIPFAVIPLVYFASKKDVMGAQASNRFVTIFGVAVAAVVSAMNLFLIVQVLFN